jgi:hypothetical protein
VASLKLLKKPKNEQDKYLAMMANGLPLGDDDMEDVSFDEP